MHIMLKHTGDTYKFNAGEAMLENLEVTQVLVSWTQTLGHLSLCPIVLYYQKFCLPFASFRE